MVMMLSIWMDYAILQSSSLMITDAVVYSDPVKWED
jgi:hypothetical protein